MSMNWYQHLQQENARVMDELDRKLRAAEPSMPSRRWINAGIEFLRQGLDRNCLDDLNYLGEVAGPKSRLSERSIDCLFENGEATELFVKALREAAAADETFQSQLRRSFGDRLLDRPLDLDQQDLFATAA